MGQEDSDTISTEQTLAIMEGKPNMVGDEAGVDKNDFLEDKPNEKERKEEYQTKIQLAYNTETTESTESQSKEIEDLVLELRVSGHEVETVSTDTVNKDFSPERKKLPIIPVEAIIVPVPDHLQHVKGT